MKKRDNHITHLSRETLEKYLRGDLSDREMHDVERLMLESDFEAEAMEGLQSVSTGELSSDLDRLSVRIDERIKSRRSFPWWQMAAVFIILISAGVLFIFLPHEENVPIALNETTPHPESLSIDTVSKDELEQVPEEDSSNPSTVDRAANTTKKEASRQAALRKELFDHPEKESKSLNEEEGMKEAIALAEVTESQEIEERVTMNKERPKMIAGKKSAGIRAEKPEPIVPENSRELKRDPAAHLEGQAAGIKLTPDVLVRSSSTNKLISGTVLNDTGEPIPGVNVNLKGSSTGTITNVKGQFSLDVSEKEKPTLVVSMIGYETEEIMPTPDSLTVVMDQDVEALSEVVVVGYGAQKSEEDGTYISAAPAIGMTSYRDYLESSMRFPEGEDKTGRVVVTFRVNADGTLSDFEVRKSPGEKYDTEAIRLIRNGPPWEPAVYNGQKTNDQVRIKIRFEKP